MTFFTKPNDIKAICSTITIVVMGFCFAITAAGSTLAWSFKFANSNSMLNGNAGVFLGNLTAFVRVPPLFLNDRRLGLIFSNPQRISVIASLAIICVIKLSFFQNCCFGFEIPSFLAFGLRHG